MRIDVTIITPLIIQGITPKDAFARTSKVVDDEVGKIRRMFDKTTKTWSGKSQPEWDEKMTRVVGTNLQASITTTSTPFVYVTLPRKNPGRATFSRDYRPKTRPRVIGSSRGRGKVVARGMNARPMNSFTPREFEHEIAERRQKLFPKQATKEVIRDLRDYFKGRGQRRKVIRIL